MTLLEVELTIISDAECAAQTSDSVTYMDQDTGECVTDSSSYEGRISEQMLCAGANGKDSCQASVFLPVSVPASVFGHLVFRTVFHVSVMKIGTPLTLSRPKGKRPYLQPMGGGVIMTPLMDFFHNFFVSGYFKTPFCVNKVGCL